MKRESKKTYKKPFEVKIPNLEGDGIAEVVPIKVDVWTDEETGEEILTPESLDLIEKTKARRMGLMLPEEMKQLRVRFCLTQQEMSELLQIGEKSYTRWETGSARPSRSINVLLCALRDGRIDVHYLRSLRDPSSFWPTFSGSVSFGHALRHELVKEIVRVWSGLERDESGSVENWIAASQGPQRFRVATQGVCMSRKAGQGPLYARMMEMPEDLVVSEEEAEQEIKTA